MSLPRLGHRAKLALFCAAWAAAAAVFLGPASPFHALEERARDWLAVNPIGRKSPENPEFIFLGIDKATTDLDGVWSSEIEESPTLQLMRNGFPWNREVYAHILDRLVGAGAKAVVFDMMFPAPREGDEAFKAALDRYRDRVVVGCNLSEADEVPNTERETVQSKWKLILPTSTLLPPGPPRDQRLGFVNVKPDVDGIVRRAHYRTTPRQFFGTPPEAGDEELLSLAARGLEKAGHAGLIPNTHEPVQFRFSEQFRSRSVHEIFVDAQWKAPPYSGGELFRDKIVLIGAAGNVAEDRLQTPFGPRLGPSLHLSAMNAALNGDFLHATSPAANYALIFGAGALAWLCSISVQRPLGRFVLIGAILLAYYGVVQVLFNIFGWYPLLLSPLLTFGGSGTTGLVWEYVMERREKLRLRRTLNRYVSKDVVKEILDNPDTFLNTLGGRRRQITVLFSDVRGFTALTESAKDPEALVTQLNEYFDAMVQIVFGNKGTLDKFIGDAVMAHWGSIVSEGPEVDACRAVSTAVRMRKSLAQLNVGWKQRGMLELAFGIGVNHGDAIVGNLGCEEKMEVSVIGDAVNLASRLEGVTKTYHVDLCIGELVEPLVRRNFILRSLDLIVVKGKTKPVEVFAVLDERGDGAAEPPWLPRHEDAMRLYRAGDFPAAAEAWREVLEAAPGDEIAEVFLERCERLQADPPTGEWKGAYEMTSK